MEDTRSVVIAGRYERSPRVERERLMNTCSDTTASTLDNALFYLTKHTKVQRKLRTLLEKAIPTGYTGWRYTTVKDVSYIDDIITKRYDSSLLSYRVYRVRPRRKVYK